MKCLLVTSIFPPIRGGSAVVYDHVCRHAPAGSMHVLAPRRFYVTGEPLAGWEAHDEAADYRVHRVPLVRPREVAAGGRLRSLWLAATVDFPLKVRLFLGVARIVRREGIDVVCVGELISGSWLGLLCKRWLGTRLVIYTHGEEVTTATGYRYFGRRRRRYLERADAVVAVSRFTRDALIDLMGVDPGKIRLIHNGVDLERFSPGEKDPRLVERYGVAGKRVLLTVGRLIPRKGIDATLDALPAILERFPDIHYLVVGQGPYRADLVARAAAAGLDRHVTFAGSVAEDELVAHYRLCDLFVMPNREMPDGDTEGFGLVFLEANACDKPVIAGRAGGAMEAVRDGENGLLVDGSRPEEIADAVSRLLADPALHARIRRRGLEVARASGWRDRGREFRKLCAGLVRPGAER